jgi:pimeloyl-ACP methyl ester carboxylesterase
MIANAAEMYRQGNGGIYDEALCLARPWGFPIEGVGLPVRIWHGALDLAVPVGMGRYLERSLPNAVATYYPHEGHHFVYDRWREILAVLVAEAGASARAQATAASGSRSAVATRSEDPRRVAAPLASAILEPEARA